MWPNMGAMGWWMALWWLFGLAVVVLLVWLIAKTASASQGRADETPEQTLILLDHSDHHVDDAGDCPVEDRRHLTKNASETARSDG